MTIVTPSLWLADMVKQSFMKNYTIQVIYNGIDLNTFSRVSGSIRQKYGLENRKVVLGVSAEWGKRKGLDVFISLSQKLPIHYKIVMIGTNSKIDQLLPKEILSIHRTNNQKELAELYTAADVLVNPTRDEVFGLINVEALACGTPGITFNSGGSPECYDETCGSVVNCDDIDAMEKEIIRICTDKPYSKEACVQRAKAFDKNERFKEYVELYERINVAGTERN